MAKINAVNTSLEGQTGTGSFVGSTSPSLTTPVLGTPSSGTLTNCTGLPISTGVSGLGSNVATFLGTPSSANLASAVTDETGSGSLVFATSPALTTPNLGTPSAVTLTNGTGLPISSGVSGLGSGVATFLATPSSANLASAVTDETGSGALVFATSPSLVTPALGTPSSGTLTSCTGLPISSGVSGLGSGMATFLGTPSSANLAATVTDETGSGSLVFATSPTLVTPALGTPSSGTLTSCTGLPISTGVSGLGSGMATFLATPSSANLASTVTDETGSGALVFATSPTLVTPTLGAASATSINFGGSTLSNYVSNTSWTPTFTFGTPGNLSVSYATQTGIYTRIGSMVFYSFTLTCTPTFTTSSGLLTIGGLPITVGGTVNGVNQINLSSAGFTYGAGKTSPLSAPLVGTSTLILGAQGNNAAVNLFDNTSVVSGVAITMTGNGFYFV